MPLSPAGSPGVAAWLRAYRPDGFGAGEARPGGRVAAAPEERPEAEPAPAEEPAAAPRELSKGRLLDIYG